MFRPFTGSSSDLYKKQESILHFILLHASRDSVWFTELVQLVQGATKRWKIECNNTQHILCPICLMIHVEFGVGSWRMYELWLIIDGITMAPAACRLSCCLYWMCAVWCVELGMCRGVWWSLILPEWKGGRWLVVTGQMKLSVLIHPPCWPCHWRNVYLSYLIGGVIALSGVVSLWGVIRKCLFGDPGALPVSLFCPVESGKLILPLSTRQKRLTDTCTHPTQTTRKSARCRGHYNSINTQP
jgi:hypothetical protein